MGSPTATSWLLTLKRLVSYSREGIHPQCAAADADAKATTSAADSNGLLVLKFSSAVSHDILSFSARVLNTTASVGALNSFEG